jgi:hypothetical protein
VVGDGVDGAMAVGAGLDGADVLRICVVRDRAVGAKVVAVVGVEGESVLGVIVAGDSDVGVSVVGKRRLLI